MFALGEFIREVGEEFAEEFALAALGAANAGEPDPLGRGSGHAGPFAAELFLFVFFKDVEGEAMVQLHADGAQDGAHGARRAALLANDFADVPGGHAQLEDRVFFAVHRLHVDCCGLVHQGPRDLADQFLDFDHLLLLGHVRAPDRTAWKCRRPQRFLSRRPLNAMSLSVCSRHSSSRSRSASVTELGNRQA